jgi:hypothetical protein
MLCELFSPQPDLFHTKQKSDYLLDEESVPWDFFLQILLPFLVEKGKVRLLFLFLLHHSG